MPMTTTNDVGVSQRTLVYAERVMLRHAPPVMVLERLGSVKQLPKNKGSVIKWRRPIPFTASTIPLIEGITPNSTQFRYEDVEATLKQYGQIVEVTDWIEDTHEDPVINDAAQQAGENIGRTIEALTFGVVRAGTNVYFSNGAVRTDVNTPVSLSKLRAVIRGLKAQKAMKISNTLSSSPDFATRWVEPAFVAVAHTDLESDIRNLPGFLPTAAYGSRQLIHENELGSVEEIRFLTSPDLPAWPAGGGAKGTMVSSDGTNADVYPILIFGRDAFGTVALRGQGAVSPSIIRPGNPSAADPLGQRGYIGWKTYFAAAILNQLWMARLEVAASAL